MPASDDGTALQAPLAACARGELSPNMALMRLFMAAGSESEAEAALDAMLARGEAGTEMDGKARLLAARALWRQTPQAFAMVKAALEADRKTAGSADPDPVALSACAFDEAAQRSPNAAVALYSLGRADLLEASAREIVDALRRWGHLGADRQAVEIGCGIGRCLSLLAAELHRVIGIDVSARMVEAARARCSTIGNADIIRGNGRGLTGIGEETVDLVLAVDVFPYLVREGLAEAHFAEASRVLRPGGALVLFNYSYRGDDELDRAEIARLGLEHGLSLRRGGERPFSLWDGLGFELVRHASGNTAPSREFSS